MEARLSPYTPDWPGALVSQPRGFAPEIGIFFGPGDLDELRAKLLTGHLAPAFAALRERALKDMQLNPEAEVGRLVPWPLRIFARKRDLAQDHDRRRDGAAGLRRPDRPEPGHVGHGRAHGALGCALRALVREPDGRVPRRDLAPPLVHRGDLLPACALVLDWAGFCLTPHGKQIVRDAIIMKGLPRIESDFKRMEYIRHMNQGIVFSSGRIIGALSLLPAHPRYRSLVDEAERDLHEMIDDYVRPDGGTLEGIAYWNYTFSTSMPLFYALARYHGQTFKDYATPSLVKTGDYALGMLSIAGDGTTYLPVNDAHADQRLGRGLVAAYCRLSSRPEWPNLYANMTRRPRSRKCPTCRPDPGACTVAEAQPLVQPKFAPSRTRARSVLCGWTRGGRGSFPLVQRPGVLGPLRRG